MTRPPIGIGVNICWGFTAQKSAAAFKCDGMHVTLIQYMRGVLFHALGQKVAKAGFDSNTQRTHRMSCAESSEIQVEDRDKMQ